MITPAQCRAARALLNWSQQKLADVAHVGVVTVRQLETGVVQPRYATFVVLKTAFEEAGIIFVTEDDEGLGVMLKRAEIPRNQ